MASLIKEIHSGNLNTAKRMINSNEKLVNEKDREGTTALMVSIYRGDADFVKFLLDKGANVNSKHIPSGGTALGIAAANGNTKIANMLIERNADINSKQVDGWTALMKAAFNGNDEIVKLFLEKDVDINAINNNGQTALTIARSKRKRNIAEILVDKGGREISSPKTLSTETRDFGWIGVAIRRGFFFLVTASSIAILIYILSRSLFYPTTIQDAIPYMLMFIMSFILFALCKTEKGREGAGTILLISFCAAIYSIVRIVFY